MTFLVALNDFHDKLEEEALSVFRDLEYQGDPLLALRFMKMMPEHNIKQQDPDWGIPDEEEN